MSAPTICDHDGTDYDLTPVGVAALARDRRAPELEEALERARVVGVLDAWARDLDTTGGIRAAGWSSLAVGSPGKSSDERPTCWLYYEEWSGEEDGHWVAKEWLFPNDTPDAARAAAAKAIESGEV